MNKAKTGKSRTIPAEGMVVAVPATDGCGFILAVIARVARPRSLNSRLLLYFVGSRLLSVQNCIDCTQLNSNDAISIVRTGGAKVLDGTWPIVGKIEPFERSDWSIPTFAIISDVTASGRGTLVEYIEDRLDGAVRTTDVERHVAERFPKDQAFGLNVASKLATEHIQKQECNLLH